MMACAQHVASFAALFAVLSAYSARAHDTNSKSVRDLLPEDWNWQVDTQGPMCGIYSVCRALTILGIPVQPSDFWSLDYVGLPQGSSPQELVAAIENAGSTATIYENMSYAELLAVGSPVIANVRSTPYSKNFDHWVCVVNSINGLRVFDGPQVSRAVSTSEFLPNWSGVGIVVPNSHLTTVTVRGVRILCMVLLLSIVYLVLQYESWYRFASYRAGLLSMATATILCATVGYLLFGTEDHSNAVKLASAPYRSVKFNEATLADLLVAGQHRSRLLIDARRTEDFDRGSLPNAVNIPVTANYLEIKDFMNSVPRDAEIVVFCQSATCDYDERVATILSQLSFRHVSVANAGFAEFKKLEAELPSFSVN